MKTTCVKCESCGFENVFQQPYAYHAGFGNSGFLYNEKGNKTLIWSSFDPAFMSLFPHKCPWALSKRQQSKLEESLKDDREGGRWLFGNPARCLRCQHPISEPMMKNIYYLIYDGSIDLDPIDEEGPGLKAMMK